MSARPGGRANGRGAARGGRGAARGGRGGGDGAGTKPSTASSMEGASRKISKRKKGTSKKKKKKLTKAQRAALAKKEEEERKAQEKEENERLMRERKEEEERQNLLRQTEEHRKAQEDKKKKEEEAELAVWLGERAIYVRNYESRERASEEWDRYLECTTRPDPASEAAMNTYINMWGQDRTTDLHKNLGMVQEAEVIVREVERHLALAIERGDDNQAARLKGNIKALREISSFQLDRATAHVLQHADEYTEGYEEEAGKPRGQDFAGKNPTCQMAIQNPDVKFGLFVNVVKQSRPKDINFPEIGLSASIGRQLSMCHVAIRLCYLSYDPLTPHATSDQFVTVGGVLLFHILDVPPPPKTRKHWKLRPLTELADSVQHLTYPVVPPGTDMSLVEVPSATWPALHVSYRLPEEAFIRGQDSEDGPPKMGWWDAEKKQWRSDGIDNVRYDPQTRVVTFSTIHAAPTAIIQHPYRDLPFRFWSVRPTSPNLAQLVLVGSTLEVVVEIGEGYCRLVKPLNDCFARLRSSKMSPYMLFLQLARAGVNMVPQDAAVPRMAGLVKLKEPAMEKTLHAELSLVVPAFSIMWSKWNADRPTKKAVCKISLTLPSRKSAKPASEHDYLTILYDHIHREAVILKADDDTEHFTEEMLEDSKLHRNLYSCLKEGSKSPEAVMVCRAASDRFTESIRHALNLARPFSFS